jgi:hypothetical protein
MPDRRLDAPSHRVKRLESWLVFIDAKHMASDLWHQIITMPFRVLPLFPDFENSFATFGSSFTQGD